MCRTILATAKTILEKVNQQTDQLEGYFEKLHPEHTSLAEENLAKNKIRQFNSIRKHLNPTLATLLRMDMFGGHNYNYRADEKQFSKELFALSPAVYEHMRNEWQFSLPPRELLEEWRDAEDELL